MKALVGGIWGLATLHAGLLANTVYHYAVSTTHSPIDVEAAISTAHVIGEKLHAADDPARWSCYTALAIGIVICFIIQTYFTRVIFLMTSGRWRVILTAALMLLLVAQLVGTYIMATSPLSSHGTLPTATCTSAPLGAPISPHTQLTGGAGTEGIGKCDEESYVFRGRELKSRAYPNRSPVQESQPIGVE
ncbi:hypothetical protein BDN71DRAFT_1592380 [Pleurotus eryngii]|uniref:Uncharacterized protein n=1 Tax=Pleurotus eryngii TaxID=5323 RepID=A0A9P5ZT00_PLEER|nr:hypothetical protein BDN71DRAFT_1592380 [Pleurotus eryngii]